MREKRFRFESSTKTQPGFVSNLHYKTERNTTADEPEYPMCRLVQVDDLLRKSASFFDPRYISSVKYSWDFYEPLRATSSPRHASSAINATVYRARAHATSSPRPPQLAWEFFVARWYISHLRWYRARGHLFPCGFGDALSSFSNLKRAGALLRDRRHARVFRVPTRIQIDSHPRDGVLGSIIRIKKCARSSKAFSSTGAGGKRGII
ncbi:hypothetical protein PUN28_013508 [Cardiocondyla obscurior]|uniref:Uncharacterized protein n=1 Tax=Cardiocondyla obscurior TaxID=286306 RepID=A0AAW2F6W1_9HYME